MTSRRTFIVGAGLTAAASRSAAGANDRIRMGVLGFGTRGSHMAAVLGCNNPDCDVVAVADPFQPNCDLARTTLQNPKPIGATGFSPAPPPPAPQKIVPDAYADYRRVLERKDVDAVLIATPDHWHARMLIEAGQTGKDAYVEKPLSHTIEDAVRAREFVRNSKLVVQVGLQQRSWDHFQMCLQWVKEGRYGKIYHAALHWQGHYSRPPEQPTAPLAGLDWDLFLGPAPKKPYSPSRQRSWRGYYDYGGGIITDQGVHIADLVHWYMGDEKTRSVSASAQWVRVDPPNPEQPPDTFAITWKYDGFVMTFSNYFMPEAQGASYFNADHGVYFHGERGCLHINRSSYASRPSGIRRPSNQPEGAAGTFVSETKVFPYVGSPADLSHARNFLDCVKSRQKPLTDVETGFTSTLPLLLGVLAVRTGKQYVWNGKQAVAG